MKGTNMARRLNTPNKEEQEDVNVKTDMTLLNPRDLEEGETITGVYQGYHAGTNKKGLPFKLFFIENPVSSKGREMGGKLGINSCKGLEAILSELNRNDKAAFTFEGRSEHTNKKGQAYSRLNFKLA